MHPTLLSAFSKSRRTSNPQIVTLPVVGLIRPTSMRMVVVFPAPFGPRNPKTSPGLRVNETPSTMVRLPITFVRLVATRTGCMRRFLYWYVPLGAALIAAAVFAHGFYSYARGDTGMSVSVNLRPVVEAGPPPGTVIPLILGDSLARGTGDETGLGIGGRFVDELRRRHINSKNIINLAINGARTGDLMQQLQSQNVRTLLAESNVIIVSIGGNDLWGDNWRNAAPRDPETIMDHVLTLIVRAVGAIRAANPRARIFVIGLYNPFLTTPMGKMLTPFVNEWNAKLVERFAKDPSLVVVQTADLFSSRDRLSLHRFHPGDEGHALIPLRIAH